MDPQKEYDNHQHLSLRLSLCLTESQFGELHRVLFGDGFLCTGHTFLFLSAHVLLDDGFLRAGQPFLFIQLTFMALLSVFHPKFMITIKLSHIKFMTTTSFISFFIHLLHKHLHESYHTI